jgi:hypothetical protein
MFVANVRADISCDEAIYNCEELWIGMTCPWGFPFCSGGQWKMFYSCEEHDEVCGDPGEVYWTGECEIGSAC